MTFNLLRLNELTKLVLSRFSQTPQDLILVEECSELQKALLKYRRVKSQENFDALKEEMTHVLISININYTILGIKDKDHEAEIKRKFDQYQNDT